ncbi:MAG: efflux RND transporter periplasmic adaptor subunit [Gemmataceae bacterium]
MIGRSLGWCACILAISGCQRPAPAPPASPPSVTVQRPVSRPVTNYLEFTGRIEAVETVEIRARVRGFLQKVHFREGVEVKSGDLLYEIDPRDYQANVARAEADLQRQRAQLQLAESEVRRANQMLASNATSREEQEQRVAARDTAQATVRQSEAALQSARIELGYTTIRSPIDGRVSRTRVTEGNLVGFNEPTLLTTVVRQDPVYVTYEASERDFLNYQRLIRERSAATAAAGTVPVEVGLATEEGFPHHGVINFRDNTVDPNTGTILIRGELPNPDRLLTPGLFARVRVPVGQAKPSLLIPEAALSADQRGQFVLVVNADNRVEVRPVQTGASQEGLIVIEHGLAETDRVITSGLLRARPGSEVAPHEPNEKPTTSSPPSPPPMAPAVGRPPAGPKTGNVPGS